MIERLKEILNYYQLSASNFADKIDVPRSSISHLLSGRNKPSLDFIMKVEQTFDEIELDWLVYGTGKFPKSKKEVKKEIENNIAVATPSLFSDSEELNISEKKQNETIYDTEVSSTKKIKKVVILYTDGTFEDYNH